MLGISAADSVPLPSVSNIGPQTSYPVPEGILNHHGTNYVALTLWALDPTGAAIPDLILSADAMIQS